MLAQFFKRYLYIQLSAQRVTVRDPSKHEVLSEVPEIAIQRPATGKAKVLAVGSAARGTAGEVDTQVFNPFAHPRSLVSDFTVAEQVLKVFVKRAQGDSILQPSPVVIMHPLGQHEGGLTQVELRAIRELALGAGASEVHIWQGPELTDEQVLSGEYPATGSMFIE
ncbi:rod shape-determining protein [Rhizobacter sp. AJA081-3]|uniref:rod shape-determining protein n=1 Tax=Rhizobacter sp. AJA081-3 TaxID=2753607 RepID=UPI001ADEFE6D|nr:rod shape-determining protein [Rhizobacter sp. AJA081-3]QTN21486.1 rod shape-determining protein [Rhizobacter sp. AJA081-3]